jgi:hypothetical protein
MTLEEALALSKVEHSPVERVLEAATTEGQIAGEADS